MNDRYKFRFWLEEEKRFFYFGFETFLTYQKQIEKALADGLKIYQSTGLKDKNGKLIYEGDIVHILDNEVEYNFVVVWDNEELDFKATNGKENYGKYFKYLSCCEDLEVIGNIYENAELLEVNQYGNN